LNTVDAVVAPIAATRHLRDGHNFNGIDANIHQSIQAGNDGGKRTFGGKSTYVQLVQNHLPKGPAFPGNVPPFVSGMVYYLRRAVYAPGLEMGSRVGKVLLFILQSVEVGGAGRYVFCFNLEIPFFSFLQGQEPGPGAR